MTNRFALLLALPAAIMFNGTLSPEQSNQVVPQIASLSLGPMPTILSPAQPTTVGTISRPAVMTSPGVKDILKLSPSVAPTRPADPVAATLLTTPIAPKPANTIDGKTKKAKRVPSIITTAGPATKGDDDEVKYVALTFDDGPSPVYTPKILAILKKEGIHATFCVIGREAKRYPEMVQQIVAEGHKIANHTMNHDEHLERRSLKKIQDEILGTNALLETIVPGTPIEFYRAPGGNSDPRLRKLVRSWGMQPLGWSVDTKDWQKPGVNEILFAVKIELHSGGVVLMHDAGGDRSDTVEALEKVIPKLKKEGYQFVFPG